MSVIGDFTKMNAGHVLITLTMTVKNLVLSRIVQDVQHHRQLQIEVVLLKRIVHDRTLQRQDFVHQDVEICICLLRF